MANDQQELSQHLKERIKELSCLYAISKIAQRIDQGLAWQLTEICAIIPQGFKASAALKVTLRLQDNSFLFGVPSQNDTVKLQHQCSVFELVVSYSDPQFSFLAEEEPLFDKICQEINGLIYRHAQAEKEALINKKLEREDRLHILAELTAGIAHELNTPLGNILGFAELLKKSEVDLTKQKDMDKIISSALQAREIVKKLMYFSCEVPMNFNLIDVQKVLKESIDLLSLQLKEKNIQLEQIFEIDNYMIYGDAIQLTQVFLNLLMNAIQASDSGKSIAINCKNEANFTVINITDFGIGISNEEKTKLFQPFYTTKKNGTGLGLAVVHGIMQAHKAEISVTSAQQKGTTFTLRFPKVGKTK